MQSIDVRWAKKDFAELDFTLSEAKNDIQFSKYQFEPYLNIMKVKIFHCGDHPASWVKQISDQFDLNHKTMAIHCLEPGWILPLHKDYYQYFKKKYVVNDIKKITRIIVFLEKSQPGHIIQIQDTFYTSWDAGQYVQWYGDTVHAAYNLGTTKRFILQITGYQE